MDGRNIYKHKFGEFAELKNVETSAQSLEQAASKPKKAEITNCYTVNVRNGISHDALRIRTVRVGTECKILKIINELAQIEFADQPGIVGYLPYKYLKEK